MENSLVSVVIPIYNVEKYIHRCVDSIVNQTYSNLEIILVDDGSTDNCAQICDDYAKVDTRIKVIHKKNGGLSDARNAGMENATGNYIVFIDSDDYSEVNLVEKALDIADTYDIDIVVWGFCADFVDDKEELIKSVIHSQPYGVYNNEQLRSINISKDLIGNLGYAWNKMYKAEFLRKNNLQFTKGLSLVEDIVFNSPALSLGEKIAFIEEPLLHYMQRPRVTLGTKFYENYFELKRKALNAVREMLVAWKINDNKIVQVTASMGFGSLKSTIRMLSSTNNLSQEQKLKYLNGLLKDPEVREILKNVELASIKNIIIQKLMQLNQSQLLLLMCRKRLEKQAKGVD
jgi:glycosyltransferase involved in cell wall biosynthesis